MKTFAISSSGTATGKIEDGRLQVFRRCVERIAARLDADAGDACLIDLLYRCSTTVMRTGSSNRPICAFCRKSALIA